MPRYTVMVDDNFHYQDEEHRREHGAFDTLDAAIAACRAIVDRSLAESYRDGLTAEELFRQYTSFGEDPYVVGDGAQVPFSAWDYARERCAALCGRN
jgi:hypothetical protein